MNRCEDRTESLEQKLDRLEHLLRHFVEKPAMPPQEWFSVAETASLTGLSEDHVRRHIKAGLLRASDQGTTEKSLYCVHRKDIDEWMAKRVGNPQPASRKRKKVAPGSYISRHHQQPAT
jgi:excisionase family DNA binding protein